MALNLDWQHKQRVMEEMMRRQKMAQYDAYEDQCGFLASGSASQQVMAKPTEKQPEQPNLTLLLLEDV